MRRAFHAGEDDPGTLTDKARLLRCFVAVLFALAVGSARAQVVITHGLATNVTTTVLATLTNLSAHPPSLLVSNGTASVTGAFSSGASGRIAILYTGCKIFDESAFTATSNHVLNFQAGSWGVANDPSGPAVGRGAAISEAIVFRFDTSVFTPLSGQVLVLSTVQAAGNYPASSAIVRNDGGGHTTRFAAATNGLTALDLRITNGSEFAYIHDSSTGGSRLAQITLDIVAATAVTATPDVVVGTHRPVTLQWVSHVVPTDATVELAADLV